MPPEKEYQPTTAKDKKKARVPSILLSRDFFTKGRNRKWIKDHGAEAVLILQTVWIQCSIESSYRVRKDEVTALPYPLPFEDAKIIEVLESAVSVGLLEADADTYYNSQIIEDQERFAIKKQNYSNAKKQRDEKRLESSQNGYQIPAELLEFSNYVGSESSQNSATILPQQSQNHIGSGSVLVSGSEDLISLKSPEKLSLLGADTVDALERWGAHRRKLKKTFDIMQAEAMLINYAGRYSAMISAINNSIQNNWWNPVEPKENASGPPQNGHKRETNFEKNMRLLGKTTNELIGN